MQQPILTQATVLDLVPFGNSGGDTEFYALRLSPPAWSSWAPGQFIMLRPANEASPPSPLWGRPFSICHVSSRHLVIFFQVVGKGTSALAKVTAGDEVTLWGPLGNSLAIEKDIPTLLLAGGIGLAPFVGYVHAHPKPWDLNMEFGHRVSLDCYPFEDLHGKIEAESHLETDADSRARFLAHIETRVQEYAAKAGLVLGCGPLPFLKAIQQMALKHGARMQLCTETRMACGVGACLGCVVKAATTPTPMQGGAPVPEQDRRYVQTCTCGPNFWADAVTL